MQYAFRSGDSRVKPEDESRQALMDAAFFQSEAHLEVVVSCKTDISWF